MTIEFFEKMCDIDSDKTYVSKAKLNGTELPLYAVEEKINICNEKEYKYYSYNQRTNNYSMRSLLWDEAEYIVGCITVYCGARPVRLIDNIKYKGGE